jgi:predicted class III extradiol MEMO1 family dioxygenase
MDRQGMQVRKSYFFNLTFYKKKSALMPKVDKNFQDGIETKTGNMQIIEQLCPATFAEYLKRTQNTICGRHPISVLLHVS